MKKIIITILICLIIIGCTEKTIEPKQNTTDEPKEEKQQQTQEKTTEPIETQTSTYTIVDTAQDKCYNEQNQINCPSTDQDFFGQDAQYLGNRPNYKNNNDGTITDLNTGLMWIKNPKEKVDYYDIYEKEFSFAGYTDWRLPTIKELYSLMDFTGVDIDAQSNQGGTPFIDTTYFDFEYGDTSKGDRIIDSQWITNSIYVSKVMNNEECFFGVNFADGRIKCYPTKKGKGYFIRYVRGKEYGKNNFQDQNDNTILDKATNLQWQKKDSQKPMNWKEALEYCEQLELANYNDWRLPNAKELQSIVDYSRSPDTTNSPAIDPIFTITQIENEANQKDYPFFWTSTNHINQRGGQQAAYISFGRGLGNMNGKWIDVHGAGCQRSDPKQGDPSEYPTGFGPQGDARRILNYVRCVRNQAQFIEVKSEIQTTPTEQPQTTAPKQPPQEAINACSNKKENNNCDFTSPHGKITGTCKNIQNTLACVP